MMGEHTPTPWAAEDPMGPDELWIVEAGKPTHEWRRIAIVPSDDLEDDGPIISRAEMAANAAFIVRACNAHDQMQALAKAVAEHFTGTDSPLGGQARTAIALARASTSEAAR